MRVEGPSSGAKVDKKKLKKSAASGFGAALDEAAGASDSVATHSTDALAQTHAVDGLLSLQEVEGDAQGRKAAYHQGMNTLDALDELRMGLLLGTIPSSLLGRIQSNVIHQKQITTDPKMRALLDDIELRAAVEIAKIEMSRPESHL